MFEIAIGTSIMTFFLRAIGTTLGSLWGWAAYEARSSNPVVCTAMLFVGLIPAVYVQLGSKYPKAGMVSIVSMCVVALSTELQTVPGELAHPYLYIKLTLRRQWDREFSQTLDCVSHWRNNCITC